MHSCFSDFTVISGKVDKVKVVYHKFSGIPLRLIFCTPWICLQKTAPLNFCTPPVLCKKPLRLIFAIRRICLQKTAPLNFCNPPDLCKKPLCLIFALPGFVCKKPLCLIFALLRFCAENCFASFFSPISHSKAMPISCASFTVAPLALSKSNLSKCHCTGSIC